MFKKIKPGVLMIVLIVLLAAYFLVRHFSSGDRTFRDKVLEFDPESVTEVFITIPGQPEQTHLRLDGREWMVLIRDRAYRADTTSILSMINQLSDLATKRYAGKGKDIWEKYELTDSAAVSIGMMAGKKELAGLMIGKFDYSQASGQSSNPMRQQQGEMSTYVRLPGEKDVYVVDGFLKMTIGRTGDAFRDRMLTGVNKQDINKITLTSMAATLQLDNSSGKWTLNGLPADSLKTARYVNSLARLSSQDFIYDFQPSGVPAHTLTMEGNNFSPIEIKAYPVADTNINWVLVSSRNPEAFFNGKKSNLFGKVMADASAFLPDAPK